MREFINQDALQAHLASLAKSINSAPPEVLEQARRARDIEMHNQAVDKTKARKKQLRDIAKQLHMPVEKVKQMVGRGMKKAAP
jgi:predicted transcriptional regulator